MASETLPAIYDALDAPARDIARAAVQRISGLQQELVSGMIEIGKALIEAKAAIGHGNFRAWLDAEFKWTERTAQNFMSAAERFGSNPKPVSHLPLSTVYKLAAPSTPEEVREKIISRLEGGETVDPYEITAEIADARREAEREKAAREKLEKKSPEARKRAQASFDRRMRELERERAKIAQDLARRDGARAAAAELIARHLDAAARDELGSGLIDQSQKMTVAAMQMADMKVWAHRS